MTDDSNYSKREIDQHFADLFDRMDRREKYLDGRLDTQDVLLTSTLAQATKTNGRVNRLESDTKNMPVIQDLVNKHENWRWYVLGIAAAVLIFGGFVYKLLIDKIYAAIDTKIFNSQTVIIKAINDQLKGSASNFTNSVSVH